jgi:hypothetical protein
MGKGAARIGVGILTLTSAFTDLLDPSNFGAALRFDKKASDSLVAYINNPVGDQTYAVQPYSGIGRAALYGVSPLIFGYGGRRLHAALLEHVDNVTGGEKQRRRLNVPNDFKSVQVDWTNDAVFYPAYINRDLQLGTFAREQAPIQYEIGRTSLFGVRCVPVFVLATVPEARTCDEQASDWYEGYRGAVINLKGEVALPNAQCYQHSLKLVSSPRRHSPAHFLSRFFESPPPPIPPPSSPPPCPPDPPSPSPPPSPPIGFTADEMRNRIDLIQAKFCGECTPFYLLTLRRY